MSLFTAKKPETVNRSELEIRVAQELKNHQDFIYETNQALQKLAYADKDVQQDFKLYRGEIGVLCKSIQIELENHKYQMNAKYETSIENIDGFRTQIAFMEDALERGIQDAYTELASHDDLIETKRLLHGEIETRKEETWKLKQNHEEDVKRIYNAIEQKDRTLRKEIADTPSQWPQIREEMGHSLDCFRIEMDGFKREIKLLGKSIFILQKHIEDLYTQIKKLQGQE